MEDPLLNLANFNDAREFLVEFQNLLDTQNIKPTGDDPTKDLNMADPQTLQDFIARSMRQFPADHYGLILWDHGAFCLQPIGHLCRIEISQPAASHTQV